MIMLNIGSKYVTVELSKTQEQYLKNSIGRQLLVFSIVWMGVRDIYKSLVLTGIFIILTDYLFNERSKLCILPMKYRNLEDMLDTNDDGKVSKKEINKALQTLHKAKQQSKRENKLNSYTNYIDNI
tara:strand:+ start:5224 stop:5601 length:378 start_codon:yes stop_codon:yes gene_type:complete